MWCACRHLVVTQRGAEDRTIRIAITPAGFEAIVAMLPLVRVVYSLSATRAAGV
jgi:hypothetical protein